MDCTIEGHNKKILIVKALTELINSNFFTDEQRQILERYRELYESKDDIEPSYSDFYDLECFRKKNVSNIDATVEKALKRVRNKVKEYYEVNSSQYRINFVQCESAKRKKFLCIDIEKVSNIKKSDKKVESMERDHTTYDITTYDIIKYEKKIFYSLSLTVFKIISNIFYILSLFVLPLLLLFIFTIYYLMYVKKGGNFHFGLFLLFIFIFSIILRINLDFAKFNKFNFATLSPFSQELLFLIKSIINLFHFKKIVGFSISQVCLGKDVLNNKPFVFVTKYEAKCPICKRHNIDSNLQIRFDRKYNRFIGVCRQNPIEHKFSFDYVTLIGRKI